MSGGGHRNSLGFGGAVGLGVAAALLIGVIAIGHAIFRQLEGAASTVLVFAEITLCVILAAVAVGVLGLLAYRGQLARYHLAERRLSLEAQARQLSTVRAEVIRPEAEALEGGPAPSVLPSSRPSILGRRPPSVLGRHLEAVPDPGDSEGAS